jgi:hypothetical protein
MAPRPQDPEPVALPAADTLTRELLEIDGSPFTNDSRAILQRQAGVEYNAKGHASVLISACGKFRENLIRFGINQAVARAASIALMHQYALVTCDDAAMRAQVVLEAAQLLA